MTPLNATLAIVVHYSGLEELVSCLASFEQAGIERLVVVDASPTGEARTIVESSGQWYLPASRNGGYAWALGIGVATYGGQFDMLIAANSDVIVLPDTLMTLTAAAASTGGVCYPVQVDQLGTPLSHTLHPQLDVREAVARWLGVGRGRYAAWTSSILREALAGPSTVRVPVGIAGSGALLAIPLQVWRHTGGMDPQYFLFEEDRAFGTRLDELNLPAFLCGGARVIHTGGFSTRGITASATAECAISEELYWRKHIRLDARWLRLLQDAGLLLRVGVLLVSGRRERGLRYWAAYRAIVRLRRRGRTALFGRDGVRRSVTDASNMVEPR